MTQGPDGNRLHDWLDGTVGQPPDPVEGTRQVMSQIEGTSQVGRWLPFPVLHRKNQAKPPTAADTVEYQPGPIPATNGRTTTVIGRNQTMFSPLKVIIAGTLVFALGGVYFVAQPFELQGGVPGAETDAPGPAAYVHGTYTGRFDCCGDEVETYDEDGNRLTLRGMASSSELAMDDPRLSGHIESDTSIDEFPQPGTDLRVEVSWDQTTITNDQGSWSGMCRGTYDASQFPKEIGLGICELTGTGAYEGLSALLWHGEGRELNGAIFPGPLPPDSAYDQ